MNNTQPLQERAALDYLSKGLPITICRGKAPIGKAWHKKTWTPEDIRRAFNQLPSSNVGIQWGPRSGIIDVEADTPDQERAFFALFAGCDVPPTPTFRSMRGLHRLFAYDPRLAETGKAVVAYNALGIRIGTNGKAAHSLVPPSCNTDGSIREWIVPLSDCKPAPLPNAVVERILAANRPSVQSSNSASGNHNGTAQPDGNAISEVIKRMLKIRMADGADGSRRLLAYCCRCVEGGLSETGSLTAIRTIERLRPFPKDWTDDEICVRLRDAEQRAQRGRLQQTKGASTCGGTRNSGDKPNQATQLVAIAMNAELWHDAEANGYATVRIGDHREHHPIRSKGFRLWLAHGYYRLTGGTPNAQATQDALGVLEARARFDGAESPLHLRTAHHGEGIFIDLCDSEWRAVEVTTIGWRVVTDPPVRFRRAKGMMALPKPAGGGSLDMLRRFVNATDNDWPLVLAWLVAAVRPVGPYPVICLHGEQGSSKSTSARAIRRLVDPNKALIRVEPKEARDLMIAANNGRVVAFDNLSHLPVWLSDALCRLSTGGGFSTRTLYENDEETIFDAVRPVIVTGIDEVATRGDLIDRSLFLSLPSIPETERRPESELWREFDEVESMIFGALLDAASTALRNLSTTKLNTLPRMADFALWATAAEPGLGLTPGAFLRAYTGNRESANELALESSPVAKEIIDLAAEGEWTSTATELLALLNHRAGYDEHGAKGYEKRKPDGWPKSAKGLSGAIKRLAPNLRQAGIDIEFWRESDRRRQKLITIRTGRESCVRRVQSVREPIKQTGLADAYSPNWTHERTETMSETALLDGADNTDSRFGPYSANGDCRAL